MLGMPCTRSRVVPYLRFHRASTAVDRHRHPRANRIRVRRPGSSHHHRLEGREHARSKTPCDHVVRSRPGAAAACAPTRRAGSRPRLAAVRSASWSGGLARVRTCVGAWGSGGAVAHRDAQSTGSVGAQSILSECQRAGLDAVDRAARPIHHSRRRRAHNGCDTPRKCACCTCR